MIKFEDGKYRYFDKNGTEITEGCMIKWPDGRKQKIHHTENDELGTDATNPVWVANGRAFPCQFGIYPLTNEETEEIEVVEFDKDYDEYSIGKRKDEFISDPNCSGLVELYQIDEVDLNKLKKYLFNQVYKNNKDKKAADLFSMLCDLKKIKN